MINTFLNRIVAKMKWETARSCFLILGRPVQNRLVLITFTQILSSFLDLLGVAFFGIVGAIAISGIQNTAQGNKTAVILKILHLNDLNYQMQVIYLLLIGILILILKSVFSLVVNKKVLRYLARQGALISTSLFENFLSRGLLFVNKLTPPQTIFAISEGVERITVGVVGSFVILSTDLSLLLILSLMLAYIDFQLAFFGFIIFSIVFTVLHFQSNEKARELGKKNAETGIVTTSILYNSIHSYREIFVRNGFSYTVDELRNSKIKNAETKADISFLPNISKYVLETAVILSAVLLGAFQFIASDLRTAVATLSIFLAAGSRIAPAIIRIQQTLLVYRSSSSSAELTLNFIKSFQVNESYIVINQEYLRSKEKFDPEISINNVNFTYPGSNNFSLSNLNLHVNKGQFVAIVGPSGSGKSTLVDLILGLLRPTYGTVTISGAAPFLAISKFPGLINYVPQTPAVNGGTIKSNLSLGAKVSTYSDEEYWRVLEKVGLKDQFVYSREGLETVVGDRGFNLSGGQKQRLAIARALITEPQVLILDEATSALDAESEARISGLISELSGRVTVIAIAHRLSTIRNADLVVYLNAGQIECVGSFNEVRSKIPNFNLQANLMGI